MKALKIKTRYLFLLILAPLVFACGGQFEALVIDENGDLSLSYLANYAVGACQGDVVFEAEDFSNNNGFKIVPKVGASGGQAIQPLTQQEARGEQVLYNVNIPSSGTYYIHIRSFGWGHDFNGLYVTINGRILGPSDGSRADVYLPKMRWTWGSRFFDQRDSGQPIKAQLNAGPLLFGIAKHRFQDPFIDKIVISKSAAEPSGLGPASCSGQPTKKKPPVPQPPQQPSTQQPNPQQPTTQQPQREEGIQPISQPPSPSVPNIGTNDPNVQKYCNKDTGKRCNMVTGQCYWDCPYGSKDSAGNIYPPSGSSTTQQQSQPVTDVIKSNSTTDPSVQHYCNWHSKKRCSTTTGQCYFDCPNGYKDTDGNIYPPQ